MEKEIIAVEDKSGLIVVDDTMEKNEKLGQQKKLTTQETNELIRLFQGAVSSRDLELAESLILSADPQTLNVALSITLESVWFLSTQQQLYGILGLIEKIIANGAYDFKTAAARSAFLVSCVSAFKSQTMSTLADTVSRIAQKLHDSIEEWNGCGERKVPAAAMIIRMCIESISFKDRVVSNSLDVEIQFQLSAFKTFLDLAGNQLTLLDFSYIFSAACLPLVILSGCFDRGCASGLLSTTAIPGLLDMLVEGGADNVTVNECFLQASAFQSTELMHILLKLSQMNNLDVDVDEALSFACRYSWIGTIECLVEEGNVIAFKDPLMIGAMSGCKQVVEWFVKRGCQDMELCHALIAATYRSQVDVAAYLLPQIPHHLLADQGTKIFEAASEGSGVKCLDGVAFLLRSNFLGDPASTYAVSEYFSRSEDNEDVAPELRAFLQEHWSQEAFLDGIRQGQEHYMNIARILKRGESPICLDLLPPDLRVAIAYLPLYMECVNAGGCLVSQRLRGQLVEAVRRLGGGVLDGVSQCRELLAVLEHRLPQFLHQ